MTRISRAVRRRCGEDSGVSEFVGEKEEGGYSIHGSAGRLGVVTYGRLGGERARLEVVGSRISSKRVLWARMET